MGARPLRYLCDVQINGARREEEERVPVDLVNDALMHNYHSSVTYPTT